MHVRYDRVFVYVVRPDEAGASHEFLQLRRRAGDTGDQGMWQAVTGLMNADEAAWRAALRLLRQATELIPAEFYRTDESGSFYSCDTDTLWHCPQFLAIAQRLAEVVPGAGHEEFRWIPRRYVGTHFTWPRERRMLAEMSDEILDDGPARPYLRVPLDNQGSTSG